MYAPLAALPASLDAPSGTASAALGDFTRGVDGEVRLAWSQSGLPFMALGSYGYAGGLVGGAALGGGKLTRESHFAGAVAVELLTQNPTVAAIAEALTTHALGEGLKLSAKPDAAAIGITDDEARALAGQLERGFAAWAADPLECDLAGRHTLHQLASAGFTSYLLQGELLATLDWQAFPEATSRTKVALLDPQQLDFTHNRADESGSTSHGVAFDRRGRVRGYWLRTFVPGQVAVRPLPKFVRATTSWGRPLVCHLFDAKLPGQVRGISPLVAALTPSHERAALQEFTLSAALIGTSFAMTLESDLPSTAAVDALRVADDNPFAAQLTSRESFYGKQRIDLKPGTISPLMPGDKLKLNTAAAPNNTYESFDAALTRLAAKAAGAMVEDVSGDYSKTSFSASRLAAELPYRINLRRRSYIAVRFYQAAYRAWVEEMIETGRIALPEAAIPFWRSPAAFCSAKFLGPGRVNADPKKAAEADVLEIENGLSTLADKLSERGLDFDEVLAQRAYELKALKEAGLLGVNVIPGTLSTQVREVEETIDEEMEPRR